MLRFLVSTFWRPLVSWYIRKPRPYSYEGIRIIVQPGVFHPAFFFSTRILLRFLHGMKQQLPGRRFLELGAGSGIISLYAARLGAAVTASDISLTAVSALRENAVRNGIELNILHSDLFGAFPEGDYDVILINPPYYKKNPATEAEHAWYCGEQLDYFRRLFAQLPARMHHGTLAFMILSDDCDLEGIRSLAGSNGFRMDVAETRKVAWEKNFIFRIRPDAENSATGEKNFTCR